MNSGFPFSLVLLMVLLVSVSSFAQKKDKKPLIDPHVRKLGPYFGVQQGRFTVGELGMEVQFKDIRLKKTKTHAVHLGLGYNIPNNALQINGGYWHKPSRLDLTYGVDICMRSNFEEERYGFSPVVGYKIFGFHIRAGYMLLTRSTTFTATNTLFVNLRFTLINNRNFEWNRRK
ncbi:MAG: hypothetical protein ACQERC_05720 [Bacteroidota bacterium]